MKTNPLIYVNFVGLVALSAGLFFLRAADEPAAARAPDKPWLGVLEQPQATPEDRSAELEALRARVTALEARLAKAEARPDAPAISAGAPAKAAVVEAPEELASEKGFAPDPDLAALVKSQVAAELETRRKRAEEEQRARQAEALKGKPRRTVAELGRELNLTPAQETGVREAIAGVTREAFQILFQVKDEKGLEQVKEQLRLAQFDPALKEQLRQKVTLNYTLHAAEVSALTVKLDGNLRQLVDQEQLGKLYQYDVQPANPEFPDLRSFFYGAPASEQQGAGR